MIRYDSAGPISGVKSPRRLVYAGKWSRPFMLTKFVTAVTTGFLQLPVCPILMRQLRTFIRVKQGSGWPTGKGMGDKRLRRAAMGWLRAHHLR